MSYGVFNQDIAHNGGYVYTTNKRLSSQIANWRQTEALLSLADYAGKRVLDIGCGDGTYTCEFFDLARPSSVYGVDPAADAIDIARSRAGARAVTFSVASAYDLPFEEGAFDIACFRGVLHHLDRPADALHEALRVAQELIVIEPNGFNPVLKVIEKVSPYHVAHEEKSYAPPALNHWVSAQGGQVTRRQWTGLVPFFCPDWMAQSLKRIEPLIEYLPGLNAILCGNYVFHATRK